MTAIFSLISVLAILDISCENVLIALLSVASSAQVPFSASLIGLLHGLTSSAVDRVRFASRFYMSDFSAARSVVSY